MSRMAVAALVLFAAPARADDAALERYQAATSVEPRCKTNPDDREIVVCGRRQADKWRVPFIVYDPGDPRAEGVSAERNRLASEPPVHCGIGAFLANCGMVGVHVSTRFDGSGPKVRELAE